MKPLNLSRTWNIFDVVWLILQFPGYKQHDPKDLNVQAMEQAETVREQNQDGVDSNGDGHSKRGNEVIDLNL